MKQTRSSPELRQCGRCSRWRQAGDDGRIAFGILAAALAIVTDLAWAPRVAFCQKAIAPVTAARTSEPESPPTADLDTEIAAAIETLDLLESTQDSATPAASKAEAQRRIDAVGKVDPQTPWLHYLNGRMLALGGRGGDAVASLRRFIETREGRNEWRAYRLLGDLFVLEFPQLAKANYRKALQLKPDEPRVLLGLSRCASLLGRADQAVRLARRAVDTGDGDKLVAVHQLARTLMALKRWDEAQAEALKAVDLARKRDADTPGAVRPIRALENQYKLTIDLLRARVNDTADPQVLAELYLLLARTVRERARNTVRLSDYEVLDLLRTGIEKTGTNPPPRLRQEYAIMLARVGRRDDAIVEFERLLEADPFSPAASEWLARLRGEEWKSDGPGEH